MVGGEAMSPSPFILLLILLSSPTFSLWVNSGSFRASKLKSSLTIIQFLSQNTQKKEKKYPSCPCTLECTFFSESQAHTGCQHAKQRTWSPSSVSHTHSVQPWVSICLYMCIPCRKSVSSLDDLGFRILHSRLHSHSHHIADGPPWSGQQICRCRCSSSRMMQHTRCLPEPSTRNLHRFTEHNQLKYIPHIWYQNTLIPQILDAEKFEVQVCYACPANTMSVDCSALNYAIIQQWNLFLPKKKSW